MLLDYMRRNTKTFLYIAVPFIAISFAFWGTPTSDRRPEQQALLVIDGEDIALQDYLGYYKNLVDNIESNFAGSLTPEMEKMLNLKQQALDGVIQRTLLEREIRHRNITVSDMEVQDSIKRYPEFQTGDRFDSSKWNAAVGNPRVNWAMVAQQEKQNLKIQKLLEAIQSGIHVTGDELEQEYRHQNEKVEIEFAVLKAKDLAGDIEISDDEKAAYYERNKQQYAEPAQVKLAYIEFKKLPDEKDYYYAEEYCRTILERVQAGDDFGDLAEYYSDDAGTRARGGDLGFFERGRMAKAFEDAAFAMEPGTVSDVVKSEFGYHIIKVEGTTGAGDKKQVSARHILVTVEASDDTLIAIEEKAIQVAVAAEDSTFEEAAGKSGLAISTTPLLPEGSPIIPGIGVVREITEIIPGLKEGGISGVIETEKAYFLIQVTERTPERIPELSEMEDKVMAAAKTEKALEAAKEKARDIVKKVNEQAATLADIEGIAEPQRTEPFTRRGYAPEMPYIPGLANAAFELAENSAADPFVIGDVIYVIVAKGKTMADPEGFEAEKESIKEQILSRRRRQALNDYFEDLREKAIIEVDIELLDGV
jgi:peptidyl-prolyl cis-trans isomerase D